MKDSQEAQRKYIELQLLSQTVKQIEQNLVNIEGQIGELKKISDGLEDMKKIKALKRRVSVFTKKIVDKK